MAVEHPLSRPHHSLSMANHIEEADILELIKASARLLYGRDKTYEIVLATTPLRTRVLLVAYNGSQNSIGKVMQYGESLTTPYAPSYADEAITDLNRKVKDLVGDHLDDLAVGREFWGGIT